MIDEWTVDQERRSIVRAVRQHLESLARAGVARIPAMALGNPPDLALAVRRRSPSAGSDATDHMDEDQARRMSSRVARGDEPFVPPSPRTVSREPAGEPALSAAISGHRASPPAPGSLFSGLDRPAGAPPAPVPASLFSSADFNTPPVPGCDRTALLDTLAGQVSVCRKCPHLAETRTQTVFGTGSNTTRLMFIGEAPGADEDRLGKPFVGRAGVLLTDMITKGMGLARDQVYIANILKCRPPENRTPTPTESENCIGYLEEQIAIIRPEYICLLGRVALQGLLRTSLSMSKARGRWHRYRGIPTIVTYHPAYLLRKPEFKREAWEDLQMLMKEMGLAAPRKGRFDEPAGA